jgi:hypothetical protein
VAARRTGGRTTVYASWNGATEVKSWRALAGSGAGSLTQVANVPKSGFETAITVAPGYKRFQVQALDAHGKVIGTSKPVAATQ